MAHVKIGSARIDERGQAHGGKAGDQTGGEVSTQNWYLHKQGKWRVFRCKDSFKAKLIAEDMQKACDNPHIGYDQWQRDTLFNASRPYGFDCSLVNVDTECDCSALVRVCMAYAGIVVNSFRTYNEPDVIMQTGLFEELKGDDYQRREVYLRAGDILCTPSSGHTVVALTDGDLAYKVPEVTEEFDADMDTLRRGLRGAQVRTLQRLLNAVINAGLEVDGEFGYMTHDAVRRYQSTRGLEVDGIVGENTWKRLLKGE